MMTRRHFQAIASLLARIEDPSARENAVCEAIIEFRGENRRFDADRFRAFVDSARTQVVAERVIVKARASKAA
jgi:hypothetical protein